MQVTLSDDSGKKKTFRSNRLVWAAFNGRFPDRGLQVHHKDGNIRNNSIDNLQLTTSSKIHRASRRKHRFRGEDLTLAEIVERYSPAGLDVRHVATRITAHGWDIEDAVSTPLAYRPACGGKTYKFFGEYMTVAEAVGRFAPKGVNLGTVKARMYVLGHHHEAAVTRPLDCQSASIRKGESREDFAARTNS